MHVPRGVKNGHDVNLIVIRHDGIHPYPATTFPNELSEMADHYSFGLAWIAKIVTFLFVVPGLDGFLNDIGYAWVSHVQCKIFPVTFVDGIRASMVDVADLHVVFGTVCGVF